MAARHTHGTSRWRKTHALQVPAAASSAMSAACSLELRAPSVHDTEACQVPRCRDYARHGPSRGAEGRIFLAHTSKGVIRSRGASSQRSLASVLRDATAAKPSSARGRPGGQCCDSSSSWRIERAARTDDTRTGLQRASACDFHGEKDTLGGQNAFFFERKMLFFLNRSRANGLSEVACTASICGKINAILLQIEV